MKKLFAIILALALIFAMSTTALAEENTSLTVNAADRTFVGYQLLKLTTSLKTEDHHEAHEGDHSKNCYNYAYTVNENYRAILQAETLANGRNELWVTNGKPADASGVTDAQILEYLGYQTSDEAGVYQTMRQVADRIYREIKDAQLTPDKTDLTGANNTIEQGYWMFVDISDLNDDNAANSLVVVDTMGENTVTITPKTALPTVEKKVKDIEDSEDDKIDDNPWHDSADHDYLDAVPFKLTGTLPSNAQYYKSFQMIFHDTLSAGLTLNADSVTVLMYDTKHKADVDTDLNDGKDVTENFDVTTTGLTDGCTFEVACENVFAIEGVTKDTTFVVSYNATLNETAVIGAAGNPNVVYMEFSNDPYDSTSTGKTETDKVTVFTYQLIVNKVDNQDHALKGAGFTLYKKNLAGKYVAIGEELVGGDMTTFIWKGLDDGDYMLVETTVPEGYNKMTDIEFSISATHSETDGEPKLLTLDGGLMGEGIVATGIIEKNIVNNTGIALPSTGAQGTMLLIGGGTMLVMVAAVFMITRKKMSVYED